MEATFRSSESLTQIEKIRPNYCFSVQVNHHFHAIESDSRIELRRVMLTDGGSRSCYVGLEHDDRFFHLHHQWATLLHLLVEDQKVRVVIKKYQRLERINFSQAVQDLEQLIRGLVAKDLVESIDGEEIPLQHELHSVETRPAGFLLQILFHPVVLGLLAAPIGWALWLLATTPAYVPEAEDYFWHERYGLTLLSGFLLGWLMVFKHELGHMFTAHFYGIRSRIELSHKLMYLVAVTRIRGIQALQPYQRRNVYLAGMMTDIFVLSLGVLVLFLHDHSFINIPNTSYAFVQQVILLEWISISWQFLFFMKTDVYYVLSDWLGIDYLLERTKRLIGGVVRRPWQGAKELFTTKGPFAWYALVVFLGVGISLWRFGTMQIPISWEAIEYGYLTVREGWDQGWQWMLDGMFALGVEVAHYVLLLWVVVRTWLKSKSFHFKSIGR